MTRQSDQDTRLPMLNPDQNVHLRTPGRVRHVPTSVAPERLIRGTSEADKMQLAARFRDVKAELTRVLGEPYFAREGFILFKGDCVAHMARLADAGTRISLTVTSPPYNIGKEYEDVRAVEDYVEWCRSWIALIHAASDPNASFWLNLGYFSVPGVGLCVPIPYLLWNRTPFFLLQEVVWTYGAGVATRSRFSPRNEKWLYFVRDPENYTFNLDDVRDPNVKYPNQKKNGKLRCNPLGKNPSDVWEFPKVTTGSGRSSKERTDHPAQFPLAVIERIVKACSNPGDIVLDPFSGSGSTGVAAAGSGRVCIGFEIREDYCRIAAERFTKYIEARDGALRQTTLFAT